MFIQISIMLAQLFAYPLPPKWQKYTNDNAEKLIMTNGNLSRWANTWQQLPDIKTRHLILNKTQVTIGKSQEIKAQKQLKNLLLQLSPWRKGPFNVFGIEIDTEWRSDWKWERLQNHINLTGKRVLDVGCGNGYYLWRMLGDGAKEAIGIDPSCLFLMQFLMLQSFLQFKPKAMVLPFKLEDLPDDLELFDVVFSMGVLYHRSSPLAHLAELKNTLKQNGEGELVLETLVVDGKKGFSLMPENRYAKMRNVWFIPTIATLQLWLNRVGFKVVEILDVTATTTLEQCQTEWMQFESLTDFLHPNDNSKTVENYPAPKRAILKAIS